MSDNKLFSYVEGINNKTYNFSEEDYNQYVINLAFKRFPDTIFLANIVNMMPGLTNQEHYDFLYYTIEKKKRGAPWFKAKKNPFVLPVAEYYGISVQRATEMLDIMNESEINELKCVLVKGGKK
jgi:hypothetical protein